MWVAPVSRLLVSGMGRLGGRGSWLGWLTAGVVTGNDRFVLRDAVGIGLHDSAQEGRV